MRPDQRPPYPSASYVLNRWKTVYISVPKAACTSMKWLVADLQEENPARFYRSVSREVTRAMTIHRRSKWSKTPMLKELSDAQLAEISTDNGWFIFAVVRHPATRLWSGWQSKLLLQEPRWVELFGDTPWFPPVPETTEDIVRSFGTFIASIHSESEQAVMRDRHFMSQTRLVTPLRTPYTQLYGTRQIPALLTDLTAHVKLLGYEGPDLTLRSSNETPIPMIAEVFTDAALGAIQEIYAADYESFGFAPGRPPGVVDQSELDESLVREVQRLVERTERIGDLAIAAQALSRRNSSAPSNSPKQSLSTRYRQLLSALRRGSD